MCLEIGTPPQCQKSISMLYKQAELTKEEVKLGHPGNWLIKSCFLSVYFDRDPLKSIWTPLLGICQKRKEVIVKQIPQAEMILSCFVTQL